MSGSVIVAGARTPSAGCSARFAGFRPCELGGIAIKARAASGPASPATRSST